ncbi:MAG: restriction endonuclease subunit S [Gammaproteobacteria bacterium]|nr:MAG: restriction endonuclease subunit S [Gammaproteobacteria bacterium]
MKYQSKKIGEVASVKGGKRLPKGMVVIDEPTPHPYLRVVDFSDHGIDRSNIKYIDDEAFEKIRRYTISCSDIYISIAGTIGRVGIVPEDLSGANLTENAAKITNIIENVDHRYLMYFLRGPVGQGEIANRTGGTSQPKLALYKIADIDFPCPPRNIQTKTAEILSAYDDLIENNRRRIQLLEQAARLLYKEWFVHLRFPGHEHTKIIDGVPEGWEKKPLGTIAPLKYGKALKNDDRVPGPFPVYGSSGIVGTHTKALVHGPTIIVGRKGNVGSVYWSPDDCHPIDTVYYIDSELCSFFLYYALQQMTFISTDVAVPGLNRDFAHSRSLLVADQKILRLFEETVSPLHQQMELLKRQNTSLAKARDILLPKLMSGEVAA